MPFFDYRCVACGHTVELLRKHDDDNKPLCEKCSGVTERQISAPHKEGVHFKGAGFYVNDYTRNRNRGR